MSGTPTPRRLTGIRTLQDLLGHVDVFGEWIQPQRRDGRREKTPVGNLCVHRVSAVFPALGMGCGSAALRLWRLGVDFDRVV